MSAIPQVFVTSMSVKCSGNGKFIDLAPSVPVATFPGTHASQLRSLPWSFQAREDDKNCVQSGRVLKPFVGYVEWDADSPQGARHIVSLASALDVYSKYHHRMIADHLASERNVRRCSSSDRNSKS